jgi:hypothetical protein
MDFTFLQPHVSPNLHIIFLVLTKKIYLVLCFIVQFSKFLIQGNALPYLIASQVVQPKNTYYQLVDAQLQVLCLHHVTSLRHMRGSEKFNINAPRLNFNLPVPMQLCFVGGGGKAIPITGHEGP